MINFRNLSIKINTNICINKIIKFIKSSQKNAFIMGNELSGVYYFVYNMIKKNDTVSLDNLYELLSMDSNFTESKLSTIFNNKVNYNKLFSLLNIKILQLNHKYIWSFFRGYYINSLDMFSTNIAIEKNKLWFVLYDFHYHYLLYIHCSIVNIKNIKDIELQYNNKYDAFTINDNSEELSYKLVFLKDSSIFNDSIRDILTILYKYVTHSSQLCNEEDKKLYTSYIAYINM